ncbi:serine hydrolase domain-containing protein [Nonomuraea sp. NPDC049152]|uniref:serine hydrolase domain-containing protein n=1 Tax=Nonomuraea sp. NPDC049152 TaxID=3154350 RepID=UPI0033F5E5C3
MGLRAAAVALLLGLSACASGTPTPIGTPAAMTETSAPPSAKPAPATPPAAPTRVPAGSPDARAEVERLVRAGAPGAVAYVLDGERVWQAAAGAARKRVPMRTDHRFRIASITKTFTAALVLQLVREGRLAVTDRVESLLPGVISTRATVADLLTHTSGIPDYLTAPGFTKELEDGGHLRRWQPRELVAQAGPAGPPGTYSYSNTNYILLGMILERLRREPYEKLVRDRIALPSTELPSSLQPDGLAHGRDGATRVDASIFWTAGGLVSTVADVAAFYRSLFGGARLEGRVMREGGYGVFSERLYCGVDVLTHSGLILGYGGAAMSTEDGRRVVVVQVNASMPGDAIAAAGRLMCSRPTTGGPPATH